MGKLPSNSPAPQVLAESTSMLSEQLRHAIMTNLERTIALLDLCAKSRRPSHDRVHIASARANVYSALRLVGDFPSLEQTAVSAVELMLKAELAIVTVESAETELSLRVADSLLQETRVRLETGAAELDLAADTATYRTTIVMSPRTL